MWRTCHMGRQVSGLMRLVEHKGSVFIKGFHWNQIRQCAAAGLPPPSCPASNPKRRMREKNVPFNWSLSLVIIDCCHLLSLVVVFYFNFLTPVNLRRLMAPAQFANSHRYSLALCAVNSINTRLHRCFLPPRPSPSPDLIFNQGELMDFCEGTPSFVPVIPGILGHWHSGISRWVHTLHGACVGRKEWDSARACVCVMEQETAGLDQMKQTSIYCLASFIGKSHLNKRSPPPSRPPVHTLPKTFFLIPHTGRTDNRDESLFQISFHILAQVIVIHSFHLN